MSYDSLAIWPRVGLKPLLQGGDLVGIRIVDGFNGVHCGCRSGYRGVVGESFIDGGASQTLAVLNRLRSHRCVDDQLDLALFDLVEDAGRPLINFVDAFGVNAVAFKEPFLLPVATSLNPQA